MKKLSLEKTNAVLFISKRDGVHQRSPCHGGCKTGPGSIFPRGAHPVPILLILPGESANARGRHLSAAAKSRRRL